MDPTEVLLKFLDLSEEFEDEYEEDSESERTEELRLEVCEQLENLRHWYADLNGHPAKISTLTLEPDGKAD